MNTGMRCTCVDVAGQDPYCPAHQIETVAAVETSEPSRVSSSAWVDALAESYDRRADDLNYFEEDVVKSKVNAAQIALLNEVAETLRAHAESASYWRTEQRRTGL